MIRSSRVLISSTFVIIFSFFFLSNPFGGLLSKEKDIFIVVSVDRFEEQPLNFDRTRVTHHSLWELNVPYNDGYSFESITRLVIRSVDGNFSEEVGFDHAQGTYFYKNLFSKERHHEDIIGGHEFGGHGIFSILFYVNQYEYFKDRNSAKIVVDLYNGKDLIKTYEAPEQQIFDDNDINPEFFAQLSVELKGNKLIVNPKPINAEGVLLVFTWVDANGPQNKSIWYDSGYELEMVSVDTVEPISYASGFISIDSILDENDKEIQVNSENKVVIIDDSNSYFSGDENGYTSGHYKYIEEKDGE